MRCIRVCRSAASQPCEDVMILAPFQLCPGVVWNSGPWDCLRTLPRERQAMVDSSHQKRPYASDGSMSQRARGPIASCSFGPRRPSSNALACSSITERLGLNEWQHSCFKVKTLVTK
jgi:hypothetical protein